jgi:tetratricopeptide (TPR) repeat protein
MRTQYIIGVLLAVLTLAAFWQVRNNDFINFDDNIYITENVQVQRGLTAQGIEWAFTTGHATNWHPLTWISLMLDYELFGPNPAGHHLMALLFHIVNTILLFVVLRRMTGALWQSAFVAALFAVHPLHVESVAWAAERKDVLSTLFWILTMGAYVYYVEKPKVLRYLIVSLLFALGLMAKPMLVTLPFVLLLLDYWPLGRYKKTEEPKKQQAQKVAPQISMKSRFYRLTLEKVPMIALAIASSVITFIVQRTGGAVSSIEGLPLGTRIANALVSYWKYIFRMVWPADLAIFYPYPLNALPAWQVAGAGLLLIVATGLVIRAYRNWPYIGVGWLWYVGTLIPVIGLVQVGAQSMADRYTYVPLIGLFILIAWGLPELLSKWSARKVAFAAGAGVILLTFTAQTWSQVGTWRNSVTVFEHALSVTSDNWIAHQNLGFALAAQGKDAEAERHYVEALRLRPKLEGAHHGLGNVLVNLGRADEAVAHYLEAIRIKPDYAGANYDLAITLARQGKTSEAVARYNEAIRLKPDYAEAHNNLGMLLGTQGRVDEALAHFSEALRIRPDFANAHNNMGILLAKQGKTDEAIEHFNEALRINPEQADARKNLDIALAMKPEGRGPYADTATTASRKPEVAETPKKIDTVRAIQPKPSPTSTAVQPAAQPTAQAKPTSKDPEAIFNEGVALFSQGKIKESIPLFTEALRLNPKHAEAHYNLGVALHNLGNLKEAVEHYTQSIRLKPNNAEAHYNLGVAYHSQGDVEKAVREYNRAVRLKSDYPQAYNNLGVAYYSQGKYEDAIAQYTKALKLKPDYEEARKNLEVVKSVMQARNTTAKPQPQK